MRLGNMIQILEELRELYGEEANVLVASQEGWPFECALHGIAVREMFDEGDGPGGDDFGHHNIDGSNEPKQASDILLVEGRQRSYGDKSAWQVADY